MLKVENIEYKTKQIKILRGVSLQVHPGEFVQVIQSRTAAEKVDAAEKYIPYAYPDLRRDSTGWKEPD